MVWSVGSVSEHEARSAIIPFVGITVRKITQVSTTVPLNFISRPVVTKKESELYPATKCAAYSSEPVPVVSGK
jgi:hypothetical protein